jgi:hypothetical protein
MGLDMYLHRYPLIDGWEPSNYDDAGSVVYGACVERRTEGEVTYTKYVGIREAIDFTKELDFAKPEHNDLLNSLVREEQINGYSVVRFGEEVGYWRKVNSIHQWFVENVQNGEDDCEFYEVTQEHLGKLNSIIQQILDDRSLAAKLLPPASGFFFGSTDIDDYYWEGLEDTLKIIQTTLETTDWDNQIVIYHSSW